MGELGGLLWALAIGVSLLILVVWPDVKRRRRVEGEPTQGPGEGNPGHLAQSEIDGLPALGIRRPVLRAELGGERLEIGLTDPGFADASGRVDLKSANALVTDNAGATIRELMIPISRYQPLVLVAREMDEDVLATLAANRKSLAMPLATVITNLTPEVTDLTGTLPVSVVDFKAGYLPVRHFGHAACWVTGSAHT